MAELFPPTEGLRQPRARVTLNGREVPVKSATVDQNGYYEANTFGLVLVMGSLVEGLDAVWITAQEKIEVELALGLLDARSELTADPLIIGNVDETEFDWFGGTIRLSGRDFTSVFIDTKTSEKYANLTASEIATKLAEAHGLKSQVTATERPVGSFYKSDSVRLQNERSEWELLTYLAREEGFACYVIGRTLYFEPQPVEGKTDTYTFTMNRDSRTGIVDGNSQDLVTSRSLTLARDISVTVKSWNRKTKTTFTATAKSTVKRPAGSKTQSEVQKYTYTVAGLTQDQAQKLAESKLLQLTRHELKLRIGGPADVVMTPRHLIQVLGTNSAFDQVYFIDTISRTYGDGLTWNINAKNVATANRETVL